MLKIKFCVMLVIVYVLCFACTFCVCCTLCFVHILCISRISMTFFQVVPVLSRRRILLCLVTNNYVVRPTWTYLFIAIYYSTSSYEVRVLQATSQGDSHFQRRGVGEYSRVLLSSCCILRLMLNCLKYFKLLGVMSFGRFRGECSEVNELCNMPLLAHC